MVYSISRDIVLKGKISDNKIDIFMVNGLQDKILKMLKGKEITVMLHEHLHKSLNSNTEERQLVAKFRAEEHHCELSNIIIMIHNIKKATPSVDGFKQLSLRINIK